MPSQGWAEALSSQQVAGPTLATFTTAASMLSPHAKHTIPADDWFIGKAFLVRGSGQVSNVVTAQPTFTFDWRLGSSVQWSSGALLCSTTAHTTVPFWFEIMMTCRAIGATASMMTQGWVASRAFLDLGATADITTLGHPTLLAPETTPAVGSTFDSNASLSADMFCACSTSNAGNAITLQQYHLISLN